MDNLRCPHCGDTAEDFIIDYYTPDAPIRCGPCMETEVGAAWKATGDLVETITAHGAGVNVYARVVSVMLDSEVVARIDVRTDDQPGVERVDWIHRSDGPRPPAALKDAVDEVADRSEGFRPEVA